MTTRVPAPRCGDCGQPCVHPLMLLVACSTCDGKGQWQGIPAARCTDCNGTGKVLPPPLTDEQIFGRKCERCGGSGTYTPNFEDQLCPLCKGVGRIRAAENRWTCLGGGEVACPASLGARPSCYGGLLLFRDDYDGGSFTSTVKCQECRGTGKSPQRCPGRTDVVAPPDVWSAAIRAWRTRTKTTVFDHAWADGVNNGYAGVETGFRWGEPGARGCWGGLDGLLPETPYKQRGQWTIVVTFVPDSPEETR